MQTARVEFTRNKIITQSLGESLVYSRIYLYALSNHVEPTHAAAAAAAMSLTLSQFTEYGTTTSIIQHLLMVSQRTQGRIPFASVDTSLLPFSAIEFAFVPFTFEDPRFAQLKMPWLYCGRPRGHLASALHPSDGNGILNKPHQGTEDVPTQSSTGGSRSFERRASEWSSRSIYPRPALCTTLVHKRSSRWFVRLDATCLLQRLLRKRLLHAFPVSYTAQHMSRPHVTTRTSALS